MDYKLEMSLWTALSVILYILSACGAWRYRQLRPGRIKQWAERAKNWPYSLWMRGLGRFLYYVGIPYLALLGGVAWPEPMGLKPRDMEWLRYVFDSTFGRPTRTPLNTIDVLGWLRGIGLGTALGLGFFFLLALTWWHHIRSIKTLSPPLSTLRPVPFHRAESWWALLLEVFYLEAHWAFYRSGPILLLNDYYMGSFLGFLIVSLEWWADPRLRAGLASPEQAGGILTQWGLALAMTVVFFFIRNFWLAVPIHWAIEMGCLGLIKSLI